MQAAIFKPGDLCGRYRVERMLGAGGFGEVYRARDVDSGAVVALKALHVRHADNTHIHQRMVAEAELLSTTRHDNLVRVFDYGMSDGVLFMVMEYLEGCTLRQVLHSVQERDAQGILPMPSALLVAREVADGVEAAHACGVIHRDLKPENVFVTVEGRIKVLDLGAGKFFGWGLQSTGLGLTIGTPMYMAPEHIRGQAVDARTDVYALGVMLYEMCAGHFLQRHADEGAKKNEIAVLQLHFDPPPLVELVKGCPAYVSELLQKAMSKAPSDRFVSMRAFAQAIRMVMRRYRAEAGFKASAELAKELSLSVVSEAGDEGAPEAENELVAAVARLKEKRAEKRAQDEVSDHAKTTPYERLSQTPLAKGEGGTRTWADTEPLPAAGPVTSVGAATEPLPPARSSAMPSAVPVVMAAPLRARGALEGSEGQKKGKRRPRLISRTAAVLWILLGCAVGVASTAIWMWRRDARASVMILRPLAIDWPAPVEAPPPAEEAKAEGAANAEVGAPEVGAPEAAPRALSGPKPVVKEPARRRPIFGSSDVSDMGEASPAQKPAAPVPSAATPKPKRPALFGPVLN